jgi:hypothetical protein
MVEECERETESWRASNNERQRQRQEGEELKGDRPQPREEGRRDQFQHGFVTWHVARRVWAFGRNHRHIHNHIFIHNTLTSFLLISHVAQTSRRPAMALPRQLQPSLTPDELAFLAEEDVVDIVPLFSMTKVRLLSVSPRQRSRAERGRGTSSEVERGRVTRSGEKQARVRVERNDEKRSEANHPALLSTAMHPSPRSAVPKA